MALLVVTAVWRMTNRAASLVCCGALVTTICLTDFLAFDRLTYRPWRVWATTTRAAHPAIPRSARLPNRPPAGAPNGAVPTAWSAAFASVDLRDYPDVDSGGTDSKRALASLYALHGDFASRFAVEQGFGLFRVSHWQDFGPREFGEPVDRPSIPQPSPDPIAPDDGLLAAGWKTAAESDPHGLIAWHAARGIDFANADGWGVLGRYPGDPHVEVATPYGLKVADGPFLIGFRSHALREEPPPLADWRLRRLELIGLLLHDEPVAYPSDDLPRMNAADRKVTRPLTAFERTALAELEAGAWVVASERSDRLRALGALPAAAGCAECHGVAEGTLLGAFSYDFEKAPSTE
ncbi:MAG: hypothetical protein AAF907_02790 [Planctomycetota bacterium]